jgi:type VI secretion system secreted protein Hcp
VLSYSWGVSNKSGSANLHDLSITKLVDKASPNLALACAVGRHIQHVTLDVSRPGAPATWPPLVSYRLGDVLITSDTHSGSGSNRPIENISLSYASIEQTYVAANGETLETRIDAAG